MTHELSQLTREALVRRVMELQTENRMLSQELTQFTTRRAACKQMRSASAPPGGLERAAQALSQSIDDQPAYNTTPVAAGQPPYDERTDAEVSDDAPRSMTRTELQDTSKPRLPLHSVTTPLHRGSTSSNNNVVSNSSNARPPAVVESHGGAHSYEISLSVMVIENGAALSVPMAAVLDKTYGREDRRDADTPVVASRWLYEEPTESIRTQRFSAESCATMPTTAAAGGGNGLQDELGNVHHSVDLDADFMDSAGNNNNNNTGNGGMSVQRGRGSCLIGVDPVTPHAPRNDGNNSNSNSNSNMTHITSPTSGKARGSMNSNAGRGSNGTAGGGSYVNGEGRLSIGEAIRLSAKLGRDSMQEEMSLAEEDEPSPKNPQMRPSEQLREVATRLARRAGGTRASAQRLRDGSGGSLAPSDFALDPNSIVSMRTLRLFAAPHGASGLGRHSVAPSALSSHGNAIYHYIVKTFAVRNGCQHSPDDIEGFGRTLIGLCNEVRQVLQEEPRHGSIASPCYVFGDLHGNFRDLFYFMDNLISFQDLRYTPHRFLFLGDYVDRGEYSVEVVAYLFSMKILAPHKVLLLRGNHEDTLVSGDIGGYGNTSFRAECHDLFGAALGEELWRCASETFAYLPLTANIDGRIFCAHGGIPRYRGGADTRLDYLMNDDFPPLLSFFEIPVGETAEARAFRQIGMDTCWADPAEDELQLDRYGFGDNPRGTGVIIFGAKAVDDFLGHFGYELIFRAHQEKSDGLKLSKSARVFTIFSTSAYVGHQNGAGVVLVADGKIRLIIKNADVYEDDEEEEGAAVMAPASSSAAVRVSGEEIPPIH